MRREDREIKEVIDLESVIAGSDVCRVAFADNNVPYIIPLNFGYTGGDHPSFWFHCANEGKKIEMMKKNNSVCFELDTDHAIYEGEYGCDWGMKYSSVVGYGKLSVVTEEESRKYGLDCIMSHYSGKTGFVYDERVMGNTTVLRLEVSEMTGKRKL